MQTDESFGLPERASRPQQRFEHRYADALLSLRHSGFTWEAGPVELLPPDEAHFPRLAHHVARAGQSWGWLRVSHVKAGQLGYLALFFEGIVRDESGRCLSVLSLLTWTGKELERAARRITHQNRVNTAINQRTRARVKQRLPWLRAGALAGLPLSLGAALFTRQLLGQPQWTPWAVASGALAGVEGWLLVFWWLHHSWLAKRPADAVEAG